MTPRGCHGPCQQGRLPCDTPQACQIEEGAEPPFDWMSLVAAAVAGAVGAAACVGAWLLL